MSYKTLVFDAGAGASVLYHYLIRNSKFPMALIESVFSFHRFQGSEKIESESEPRCITYVETSLPLPLLCIVFQQSVSERHQILVCPTGPETLHIIRHSTCNLGVMKNGVITEWMNLPPWIAITKIRTPKFDPGREALCSKFGLTGSNFEVWIPKLGLDFMEVCLRNVNSELLTYLASLEPT